MLWVRPGVLEANASRFCCVSVLMQVDLPALERPTKAISGYSCGGRNSSLGAVVRKRAVCIQASALSAGLGTEAWAPGEAVIGVGSPAGSAAGGRIVESPGFAPQNLQHTLMKLLASLLTAALLAVPALESLAQAPAAGEKPAAAAAAKPAGEAPAQQPAKP